MSKTFPGKIFNLQTSDLYMYGGLHLDDIPGELNEWLKYNSIYYGLNAIYAVPTDYEGHHWELTLLLNKLYLVPLIVDEKLYKMLEEEAFKKATSINNLLLKAVKLYLSYHGDNDE
jgi:hypothetical protein